MIGLSHSFGTFMNGEPSETRRGVRWGHEPCALGAAMGAAIGALPARSIRIRFSSVLAQMTGSAQGDKVLSPIVPLLTSQGLVVNLEILHRSTILTSPVVPL